METDKNIVSYEYFVDLLGLTSRQIRNYGRDGVLVRAEISGHYLLEESKTTLIKHLLTAGTPDEERKRRALRIKAENDVVEQQMRMAEAAGNLVEKVQADAVLADLLVTSRKGLDNCVASIESSSSVREGTDKAKQVRAETLTELDGVLEKSASKSGVAEDDGFGDDAEL